MTQDFIFHDSKLINYNVFAVKVRAEDVKHLIGLLVKQLNEKKNYVLEEEAIQLFYFTGVNVH